MKQWSEREPDFGCTNTEVDFQLTSTPISRHNKGTAWRPVVLEQSRQIHNNSKTIIILINGRIVDLRLKCVKFGNEQQRLVTSFGLQLKVEKVVRDGSPGQCYRNIIVSGSKMNTYCTPEATKCLIWQTDFGQWFDGCKEMKSSYICNFSYITITIVLHEVKTSYDQSRTQNLVCGGDSNVVELGVIFIY